MWYVNLSDFWNMKWVCLHDKDPGEETVNGRGEIYLEAILNIKGGTWPDLSHKCLLMILPSPSSSPGGTAIQ